MSAAASEERELTARVKALNKAIAANEPASSIIALMEVIKGDAAPSEDIIRSTKAGMIIGKLRSNSNKEIARTANEIVAKWRKGVEAEKRQRSNHRTASPAASTPKIVSPAPAASAANQPYSGNTESRTWKGDKVDMERTGDEVRDAHVGIIYNGLAFRSTVSIQETLIRAMEVEDAAYKEFKGSGKPYRNKLRSLFMNLKNKTNAQLRKRVMSGEIPANRFVVMSDEELRSAEQRQADKEFEAENMKKAQVPMAEKSISDALKCGRCGQKKVSYSQAQTRSADEPMTTFCECTVCGNRWKFS